MINYQTETDKILSQIKESEARPRLLLHSCCAPCSSYVMEYLRPYFRLTVLFYNPNIAPAAEYEKRKAEQKILIGKYIESENDIDFIDGDYGFELFEDMARGLETEREGGNRCLMCFKLRLNETAKRAFDGNFDFFATTLTVSPHKNAVAINQIGESLASSYKVKYLLSDFKKRNGYAASISLSRKYNLYRQNYCGCKYSEGYSSI